MTRTARFVSTFFGYIFTIPFILLVHFLRLLIGKQNAVKLTGKLVTKTAVLGMGILVPRAQSAFEFDSFKKTLKKNFFTIGPIYDLILVEETSNRIEFKIQYCPVASTFRNLKMEDLCKYSCAADLVVAKMNKGLWEFERSKTIGTGFDCCNHTYIKKIKKSSER
jgi:hypothetical protein